VLDDVRRRLDERGRLGLLYFEVAGDPELEARRGWQALDARIRSFAAALIGQRGAGILEPDAPIAITGVRGEAFAVFTDAGAGAGLDQDVLAARAPRFAMELTRALEGENAGAGLIDFQHGFALLRRDAQLRTERSIQRAFDEAFLMALTRRDREDDDRAGDLDAILSGGQIRTLWQSVLDLRDRREVGREVFSHGPESGPFADPERLLGLAERTGRLVELERVCHTQALNSVGRSLPAGARLFLNASSHTLRERLAAGPGFEEEVRSAGLACSDVVVEIAERQTRDDRGRVQAAVARLRHGGFAIAIDDMGAGNSSLQAIVDLEPEYMKFDVALVRGIDRSLIKRSLLETLVELSRKIGSRVVAEGIESEAELQTLVRMGVQLGQGNYLAPPRFADAPAR
jgi:EAL domain-containing protein (putative c-di-GMP-specific phosphodiesterase class I)